MGGCACDKPAGKAERDHQIFAPTWSAVGSEFTESWEGGEVLDAGSLELSDGTPVSPLVWSPRLRSPSGKLLRDVGLRIVNRTAAYRCKQGASWAQPPEPGVSSSEGRVEFV